MKLSDREIQNTLDLLKKKRGVSEEKTRHRSAEELSQVDSMVERIGSSPEIRQDKVDKLKKAIESSSYDVSGDDVAKKLIGRIISDKIR